MKRLPAASRASALGLAFLALFALLFSAGEALGLWPPPPENAFHGTDLVAGLAFGLALLLTLSLRSDA